MLGHLLESKLQYHEPERFWKVFKLWGQTVNIREQQDAFDFFQALIDQIDEHLKVHWFTRYFMSYWKICKLICSAVKRIMSTFSCVWYMYMCKFNYACIPILFICREMESWRSLKENFKEYSLIRKYAKTVLIGLCSCNSNPISNNI